MTNNVNQNNGHYDDKSKNGGVITKTKTLLGKAISRSTLFVIVGGLSLGAAIVYGLQVIGSSECGGFMKYKSSASYQEFLLKKENCRQPDTTTQVQNPNQ
jgi:hypothetical protein